MIDNFNFPLSGHALYYVPSESARGLVVMFNFITVGNTVKIRCMIKKDMMYKLKKKSILSYKSIEQINRSIDINI